MASGYWARDPETGNEYFVPAGASQYSGSAASFTAPAFTTQNIVDAYRQTVGAGTMTEAQFVQEALARGVSTEALTAARNVLLNAAPSSASSYGGETGAQIQNLYQQYLGRPASNSEIDYYFNSIVNHGNTATGVAHAIQSSPEYQARARLLAPATAPAPAPAPAGYYARDVETGNEVFVPTGVNRPPAVDQTRYYRSNDPVFAQMGTSPQQYAVDDSWAQILASRGFPNVMQQVSPGGPDEAAQYALTPAARAEIERLKSAGLDVGVNFNGGDLTDPRYALVGKNNEVLQKFDQPNQFKEYLKVAVPMVLGSLAGVGAFGNLGGLGGASAGIAEGMVPGGLAAAGIPATAAELGAVSSLTGKALGLFEGMVPGGLASAGIPATAGELSAVQALTSVPGVFEGMVPGGLESVGIPPTPQELVSVDTLTKAGGLLDGTVPGGLKPYDIPPTLEEVKTVSEIVPSTTPVTSPTTSTPTTTTPTTTTPTTTTPLTVPGFTDWLKANPELAKLLALGAGGLLGASGGSSGSSGGYVDSGYRPTITRGNWDASPQARQMAQQPVGLLTLPNGPGYAHSGLWRYGLLGE